MVLYAKAKCKNRGRKEKLQTTVNKLIVLLSENISLAIWKIHQFIPIISSKFAKNSILGLA